MTTLEDIIRIAVNAHDGMKDMVGNPAVAHVLAVGLMGKTVAEQKAAFLHDVVEDSDITIADLRAEGVEEDVLAAVDLLTHRAGTTYEDYVRNIVCEGAREVAEQAYGPSLRDGACYSETRLGRKSDVVPILTEILGSGASPYSPRRPI